MLVQFLQAPVLPHARMKKILVDRGQLVFQRPVKVRNDFVVAFHNLLRQQVAMEWRR